MLKLELRLHLIWFNMRDLKIGIITQARVGSSRLPGKTLLKIGEETLLEIHFKRLLESGLPVFLATTTESEAFQLIEIANKLSIPSKIGSLDDVLSRYYLCAKEFHLDVVIRVTSDCPLISSELINAGLDEYLKQENSENVYYSNTQNRFFPRGLDFEIFSFKLLEMAYLNCLEMRYREHVTPYLYSNVSNLIKMKTMTYDGVDMSSWRICVDTKEDFKLIECLINNFKLQKMNYKELVEVLNKNDELKKINLTIQQKEI